MKFDFLNQKKGQFTLFLDRDGVLNKRLPGEYVRDISQFEFIGGVKESLYWFNQFFDRIFIVTNQQGIDKGIMDHEDLRQIHNYMLTEIEKAGGKVDQIYYCPHLSIENSFYRKPNPGMALLAKEEFPEIEFESSIMIGDSFSDIIFGNSLGMKTILIKGKEEQIIQSEFSKPNFVLDDLASFGKIIKSKLELT